MQAEPNGRGEPSPQGAQVTAPVTPASRALRELVDCVRESARPGDEPGARYVGLEHIARGGLRLLGEGKAGEATSEQTRFRRGDLLFGRLRPYLRKLALAPFDGVCSPDILVLSPAEPLLGPVAALSIRSPSLFAHADRSATGTRMPRVSWSDLGRFPMPLPPPAALRAFGGLASPLLARLLANAALARSLEQLRDALLPRFLAG
jgi:type I restriction enzyme, S subunit